MDKTSAGLHRDYELGVFKSFSGPETETNRKEIIKTFITCNLSITTETNTCAKNFLDTTFDLINIFINQIRNQMTTQRTQIKLKLSTKRSTTISKIG